MKKTDKFHEFDKIEEPEFSAEERIISKEISEAKIKKIQKALDSLTSRQREAIFLRFYEGLSYEEVAEIMNISVKGTYKIIARSLASLKEKISKTLLIELLIIYAFKAGSEFF